MGFSEIDLYLICTKKGDGEILDSQISPFTWAFMASPAGFEPPERPENAPVAHFQRGQRALSAHAGLGVYSTRKGWRPLRDSNPRPSAPEADALSS